MDENDEGDIDQDAIHAGFRAQIEARRQQRFGPPITVKIPQGLYTKAQDHQDELTQEERELLLSRGDVIGKALAQPSSLSDAERNDVKGLPSPDVVRANIERATNGKMSTVDEILSKARLDVRSLSKDEIDLIANNFHESSSGFMSNYNDAPGAKEARNLLTPAMESEAMMAVIKQQIIGPRTSWDAFIIKEKDAQEQRRIAEAARMEDFNKVNGQHNVLMEKRMELQKQREALGEHDFGVRLGRLNAEIDENLQSSKHKLPQYPSYSEAFGGGTSQAPGTSPSSASSRRSTTRPFRAAPYPPVPGPASRRLNSAYMVYADEQREKVREENPGISLGRVGKLMGEQWAVMSEMERAPYETRAAAQNED
ncbi:uncharacterized protein PAC_12471 [Phialocephala subalpina]|uniref:HMG box domain-containing protein n=1 Tax=Phialocephala subalpina TaxID=576137 RepID=A0A1L7XC11_9HELO|nr:uncharacterized protein PAC_12471 [Phialocephala subalpina]